VSDKYRLRETSRPGGVKDDTGSLGLLFRSQSSSDSRDLVVPHSTRTPQREPLLWDDIDVDAFVP
jgi:hypothetical protein